VGVAALLIIITPVRVVLAVVVEAPTRPLRRAVARLQAKGFRAVPVPAVREELVAEVVPLLLVAVEHLLGAMAVRVLLLL
jgi:hypothetical protein